LYWTVCSSSVTSTLRSCERAVVFHDLAHHHRPDRPAVVEVDAEREARAIDIDVVVVFLGQIVVVVDDPGAWIEPSARDVVDVAAVMTVPADQPQRRG